MARVRIVKVPKALSGLEVKMNPGLYGTNGNSQFNKSAHLEAGKISQKPTEVRQSLTAVPREKANLEAEGGETAVVNVDGIPAHFKISGPRHTNGGVPLNLPDNSFIFSDTAKMKIKDPNILAQFGMKPKRGGYTPAEIAKKYDINKFRKVLADPNTDDLQRKTAEMMIANYNEKLAKLALAQESVKGFPQGIPVIAMPYIENMEMNPATFLPDQAQEQSEETEQPDAEMGTSRYGSQVINQFPTKRYGGLPKAQYGPPPNTAPKKSKEETRKDLDAAERKILGMIADFRAKGMDLPAGVADAYEKVEKAKKMLGPLPESEPYKGEMSWVTAEGHPIDDPKQGATGYWDRVRQHWSNDFDPYDVDPKELERVSKLKGYSSIEVPRKSGKAAQEIVSKLNPYNTESVIDYAGNILSAGQKGMNAALTGNFETPGITYLRTNPGNEGTALLIDVVSDPLTYLGPKGIEYGVKGAYKGAQKVLPYAKDLAEFTIKYGKQAGAYLAKNLPKLGKYISKKGIEALKSEVVQNLALAGISRAGSYGSYQKASEEFSGKNKQIEQLKNELEQLKEAKQDTTSVLQPAKPKVDTTKAVNPLDAIKENIKKAGFDFYHPTEEAFKNLGQPEKDYLKRLYNQPKFKNLKDLYFEQADGGAIYKSGGILLPKAQNGDLVFKKDKPAGTKETRMSVGFTNVGSTDEETGEYLPFDKSVAGKGKGDVALDIKPWYGDEMKTNYTPEEWAEFVKSTGFQPTVKNTAKNPKAQVQEFQYYLAHHPDWKSSIDELHGTTDKGFGKPTKSKKKYDGFLGRRWDKIVTKKPEAEKGKLPEQTPAPKITITPEEKKNTTVPPQVIKRNSPVPVKGGAYAPWWLQDIVKTSGAAADLARVNRYLPWQATPEVRLPDATFYDPTRELAANAEQANIQTQGLAAFTGPQALSARSSAIQGQAAKNAADIMARYNNMNVQLANQLNQERTSIMNTAAQQKAALDTQLFDKYTIANQQFDNSMNMARQNLRQSYIDAITNRAKTQALNTLYPNYYTDPSRGGMLTFAPDFSKIPAEQPDNTNDYYEALRITGDPDRALRYLELRNKGAINDPYGERNAYRRSMNYPEEQG